MAESAGLALGAISLGLEVCKGIITYADAIRNQTDDLKALEQHAKALAATLDTIKNILPNIDPSRASPGAGRLNISAGAIGAVQQSLILCQSNLQALQAFVVENACGCSIAQPSFRTRCKDGYRSLKYGFKGKKRAEMETRLVAVNSSLLVALQTVDVEASIDHVERLDAIESKAEALAVTLHTHATYTEASSKDTSEILERLEANLHSVQSTAQSIAAMSSTMPLLQTAIRDSTITVTKKMDIIEAKVQTMTIARENTIPTALMDAIRRIDERTEFWDAMNFKQREVLALGRLMTRPSELNSALDDMGQMQGSSRGQSLKQLGKSNEIVNHRQIYKACECEASRTTQNWMFRLGILDMSKKKVTNQLHRPGCRFSAASRNWERQQTILAARVQGFRVVLDIALGLSWGWNQGAGGFSISPALRYHTVVPDTAPHIKLYRHFMDAVRYVKFSEDDELEKIQPDLEWIFSCIVARLRKLYDSRQISPDDVDQYGRSALHHYVELLFAIQQLPRGLRDNVTQMAHGWGFDLIHQYGVPAQLTDALGQTMMHTAWSLRVSRITRHLVTILPPSLEQSFSCPDVCNSLDRLRRHPEVFSQAFDVNRFTEAILKKDKAVIHRILCQDPKVAQTETSILYCNYMTLAIGVSSAEIVIEALKSTELGQSVWREMLSGMDTCGFQTYAEHALRACNHPRFCDSKPTDVSQPPQQTPHNRVLHQILREYGVMCTDHPLMSSDYITCEDCCLMYALELRKRRQELKEFARAHLSPRQCESFGLDDEDLLDSKTSLVVQSLRNANVEIPSHLITEQDVTVTRTLFHTAGLPAAKAYKSVGFADFEATDRDGHTALEYQLRYPQWPPSPNLTGWFIDQGISLSRRVSAAWLTAANQDRYERKRIHESCHGTTIAHLVAGFLSPRSAFQGSELWSIPVMHLLKSNLDDGCLCICAPTGRRPIHYFIRSHLLGVSYIHCTDEAVDFLTRLFRPCGVQLGTSQYKTAFRLVTLELLGIPHTCDDHEPDQAVWDDFCEDQTELAISLFEHVMDRMDQVITEDQLEKTHKHLPAILDQHRKDPRRSIRERKQQYNEYKEAYGLWFKTWSTEVNTALDALYEQDVTAGKVQAAERLGVRWQTATEPKPSEERDWDWYIRQIEEI